MTTPARAREAARASTVFQAALAQIGAQTTADALVVWEQVPAVPGASLGGWLNQIIRVVFGHRKRARSLARSHYRLVRALHTGYTIQEIGKTGGGATTLGDLRSDFGRQVSEVQNAGRAGDPATTGPSMTYPLGPFEDDDESIIIEEIARLDAEAAEMERLEEEELRRALAALGSDNLAKKIDAIDDDLPASLVDRLRDRAHLEAGNQQAADASRSGQNGGRSEHWHLASRDPRALGYIRVSRSGTPCGWCAMLISRGPIYKTAGSATVAYNDGDLYHDNCNCYAEPIFSAAQYDNDPRYDLNRTYAKQWPQVTRGLSGKAALSAWRRFVREQAKVQWGQEPRSTNAQEA